MFEGVLEFDLFVVAALCCIRGSRNDLAPGADALPESAVIELATIGLAGGVINILDIDKNGNSFHNGAFWCVPAASRLLVRTSQRSSCLYAWLVVYER
jgi:hypothetical protein